MRSTSISFQSTGDVLFGQQEGGVKNHLQTRQELANSLVFWRQIFQTSGTLEFRLEGPVKGKSIQKGWISC